MTSRSWPTAATKAPAAPSASLSAAGTCPPARPRSTPPTPAYAHPANADPPPSRPGAYSTGCAAAPNAAPTSSPQCSHWKPPPEPEVGKGSVRSIDGGEEVSIVLTDGRV